MRKRSVWRMALAAVALIATAMALYVQLAERRARQEEDRHAVARLEKETEESRSRIEAIEQRQEAAAEPSADQPLPGAVLRRGESGSALQQVRSSQDEQAAALARLQESVDTLALQMEQSDQALRRDLEQIRTGARREQAVSNKTLILLLAALVPLIILSLRPPPPEG